MLIQTYGLFWHIDHVHWGQPNNKGSLLGYREGAKSKIVDFRSQVGIYALYADYDLIYIGQTGAKAYQKLFGRLKSHRIHLSGRWNRFSWFGVKWVKGNGKLSKGSQSANAKISDALNHLEAILIDVAEPKLNRQGGKWSSTVKYKQYRDEEKLGSSAEMKIENLHKRVDQIHHILVKKK